MYIKHLIIILLFLIADYAQAQSYYSRKMEDLGSEIPQACLPQVDSIFDCPALVKGKSLIVNYNSNGEINHIGISLFSNETKLLINLPVCNFIERMMLELVLEEKKKNANALLYRYKMHVLKNGIEYETGFFTSIAAALDNISTPSEFGLLKEPERFSAVWNFNQSDRFVFSFPASRDLIFGTDKKESDEMLNKTLFGGDRLCFENKGMLDEVVSEADLSFNAERNIYIRNGSEFILTMLNSNTYYKKEGDVFELLFSKDYPAESLANLVQKNYGNEELDHQLHVTHKMYGNFSPDFDISLKELLCFFRDEYDIFTAVTSADAKEMKLTAVLHSKDYNFVHLLLIRTPVDNIFLKDGMMTADFYTNIPQHSIRSLMGNLKNE